VTALITAQIAFVFVGYWALAYLGFLTARDRLTAKRLILFGGLAVALELVSLVIGGIVVLVHLIGIQS
jgi:hypothetical protein